MYIAQTNSTNTYLKEHPQVDEVYTGYQTAGRGQMGNGWESEQGKNALVSVRLRPKDVIVSEQWNISMLVSLALWQVVATYVPDEQQLTIKWPNDLYYGDKKLAGVLIENTLSGQKVDECIVGIGLNINQTQWTGNAPNPISIKSITGKENNVEEIVRKLTDQLHNINITSPNLNIMYMKHLYRRVGMFWWEEREVSLQPTMNGQRSKASFEAEIVGLTEQGELILKKRNKEEKKYHFKQIKYII